MIFRHACLARTLFASTLALSALVTPGLSAAPNPGQAPDQAPGAPEARPELQLAEAAPAPRAAPDRAARQARQKRREAEREKRSQSLRNVMNSMGIGDRALQDEVLRHIAAEVRERGLVRRNAQTIYNALRDPRKTDDEVRDLLRQYHVVVGNDRARRYRAEQVLNERINYRENPRLEAMLLLFGAIGDAPIALSPTPRAQQ